jgi:hypothetical protein
MTTIVAVPEIAPRWCERLRKASFIWSFIAEKEYEKW